MSHETPRIPPQKPREAPTPTLEAEGQENNITAFKVTKGSCCVKLTVDSFIGDIIHVEAFGAVGSSNFVAVFRLLLRSYRQSQHDQRVNYTQHQHRLHFGYLKKEGETKTNGALQKQNLNVQVCV